MPTLIAYRFATDNQLPRLPYMTRLDAFILMGTVLFLFADRGDNNNNSGGKSARAAGESN